MSPVIARSLRRAALAGGALAATLIGHALTVGDARILPVAPLLWLSAIALAILPAASRRTVPDFRAWSPLTLFTVLLTGQGALHLLLHGAPWALGLGVDHGAHAPLLTAGAAVIHLIIALAFLAVLCVGQGLLVRAMAVARALFAPERRRSLTRPSGEVLRDPLLAPSQWRHRPRSSRGPPAPALPPAGPGRALVAL